MSINMKLVSHEKLIKYITLQRDVIDEIIRRLDTDSRLQDELDEAEDKIGDLEMGIQESIDRLKEMI